MRRALWPLLALVLLVCSSGAARAENKEAAREAYRVAKQQFNLGEYGGALEKFKEAYRNYEDPSFLFNIGQCERLLGHKQEAVRSFKTYLLNAPEAPNRDEVHATIDRLEAELKQERESQQAPPQGAMAPSGMATAPGNALAASPAPAPPTPVYKKWWLWAAIGGAAAVALGVGLGVGLSQSPSSASASTTLGTYHPF